MKPIDLANPRITSAGPKQGPHVKLCCGPCNSEKPLSAFPFGTNPNFRQGMCIACQAEIANRRANLKPIRGVAPQAQQVKTLEIKREY